MSLFKNRIKEYTKSTEDEILRLEKSVEDNPEMDFQTKDATFTKVDKLSSSQRAKSLRAYQTEMLKIWEEMPMYFDTSSETGFGRQELLNFIEGANESFYDS